MTTAKVRNIFFKYSSLQKMLLCALFDILCFIVSRFFFLFRQKHEACLMSLLPSFFLSCFFLYLLSLGFSPFLSPNLVIFIFQSSSPISYDSYQHTRFLWDMWCQPTANFSSCHSRLSLCFKFFIWYSRTAARIRNSALSVSCHSLVTAIQSSVRYMKFTCMYL